MEKNKTNLDETRDRLEINQLDELSRKQLFNKFVEKGGEVVKDGTKKAPTHLQPISNKQAGSYSKRPVIQSDTNSGNYGSNRMSVKNTNTLTNREMERKKLSFWKRLVIWFKAYSNGVIELNGKSVNYSFLVFISKTIYPSLAEISSLIYSILYPESEDKDLADDRHKIIVSSFADLNDYELLERVRKLYNKDEYNNILKNMSNMSIESASDRIEDFRIILKGLYIIKFYVPKLSGAITKGFEAHNVIDKLKKDLVDARIATFNKVIDLIYNKYYDRLLTLVSYVAQKELVSNVELNEFLDIKDEDILGYYTLEMKREIKKKNLENRSKQQVETEKEIQEKKQQLRENKIVSIGMAIIEKSVSFEKTEGEKDSFYRVSEKDEVYKLKVLFDFFEREYGYVFISNRVKYAVMYTNQKKVDYQHIFNDAFANLSDLPIKLNEYATMATDLYTVENDAKIGFTQKSSIVSEKKLRLSYISRNIQNSLISIISPIKEALDRLLLNKEERDSIIENQNEIIKVDTSYLKKRPRIQDYTVIKAITEAYYFISALNYLLTLSDLSHIGTKEDDGNDIRDSKHSEVVNDMDNFISDMKELENNVDALEDNSDDKDASEVSATNIDNINLENINTDISIDDILSNNEEKAEDENEIEDSQNKKGDTL